MEFKHVLFVVALLAATVLAQSGPNFACHIDNTATSTTTSAGIGAALFKYNIADMTLDITAMHDETNGVKIVIYDNVMATVHTFDPTTTTFSGTTAPLSTLHLNQLVVGDLILMVQDAGDNDLIGCNIEYDSDWYYGNMTDGKTVPPTTTYGAVESYVVWKHVPSVSYDMVFMESGIDAGTPYGLAVLGSFGGIADAATAGLGTEEFVGTHSLPTAGEPKIVLRTGDAADAAAFDTALTAGNAWVGMGDPIGSSQEIFVRDQATPLTELKETGDACTPGTTLCASGFCVDGYCCENACDGVCDQCDKTGQRGTCAARNAGTDPDNECTDETGTNMCGMTGSCDGAKACAYVSSAVQCQFADCPAAASTAVNDAFCDGVGACTIVADTDCTPYACNQTNELICGVSCVDNAGCAAGFMCDVASAACVAIPPPPPPTTTSDPGGDNNNGEEGAGANNGGFLPGKGQSIGEWVKTPQGLVMVAGIPLVLVLCCICCCVACAVSMSSGGDSSEDEDEWYDDGDYEKGGGNAYYDDGYGDGYADDYGNKSGGGYNSGANGYQSGGGGYADNQW